jgi:hypothetical protein
MSKVSYKRLGVALESLAVPFMLVGPVAAAPSAPEVSSVELACLAHDIDISTCTGAVTEGIYDVVEGEVADNTGIIFDLGIPAEVAPGGFPYDINALAVNPLPPLPPAPREAGYVPFQ